jgi:hypothetical protein
MRTSASCFGRSLRRPRPDVQQCPNIDRHRERLAEHRHGDVVDSCPDSHVGAYMKWRLIALVLLLAGAVAFGLSRRKPAAPAVSPEQARAEANQIATRLARLDGYPFDARYSDGAREQAVRLAGLTKDAYEYYAAVFPGARPALIATFLTPADWKRNYGMPSYYPPDRRLRVATDDNALWQSFGKIARVASPFDAYPRLKKTYADEHGNLQLRRFLDLLTAHELAHAFEHQGGAVFLTHWLQELFANLALHAFIATKRPSELANLTTLPVAVGRIGAFNVMMRLRGYTSLDDFDRHYPAGNPKEPMSDQNYGWYQLRLMRTARDIFDEDGEAALKRLWAFGQAQAAPVQRPEDYYREHGTLSGWSDHRHAKDLAASLAPR